ncbi:hypothetical protein HC766_03450 [Candidatus Gracilibacteria bacterium]|nr:hypothetical protein [Candidatus Gracilibacteria bacterium]
MANKQNLEENVNLENQSTNVTTAPKVARVAVEPQYGGPEMSYNQGQYQGQGNVAQQNWTAKANTTSIPNDQTAGQNYYNNVAQSVSDNQYFNVQGNQPSLVNSNELNKPKKAGFFRRFTDYLIVRWWLVLLLVIAIALSSLGFYAFQLSQNSTKETFSDVKAFIEAPTTASSGSPVRWKVRVVNQNNVSIQQVEVKLNFDRTFRYTKAINPDPADTSGNLYKLASLSAQAEGTNEAIIQFEGTLSGNIDEEAVMSGEVTYVPTPLAGRENSRIGVPIEAERTRITSPQIGVTMTPTQRDVQNGSEAEIAVVFENLSEKELKDLRVRMTYPDRGGFTYSSSELILDNTTDVKTVPDDGNNVWFISSLPRLRTQTLKVKGIVQGADGVKLNFW